MKASDIQPGDQLPGEPTPLYTVLEVDTVPTADGDGTLIRARVQYRDGGDGYRAWLPQDDVTLTRP